MRFYHTLTRSRLLGLLLSLMLVLLLAGQTVSSAKTERDGATHQLRMTYLERLGYRVDGQHGESKTVRIPQKFSAVYERYNGLQKQAGFDLSAYRGCTVTVYRYPLAEQPDRFLTLMVSDGTVIGGDVADTALNGEMKPLKNG